MFKKIHIIVNPASGQPEPVLYHVNKILNEANIDWDVTVTHRLRDARYVANAVKKTDVDAIAVYGGDGSIMQAARALVDSPKPLIILPGGTANVMAKELEIPSPIEDSLSMVVSGKAEIKEVDMGCFNDTPFLLRVNFGLLADMVLEANPDLKSNLGQFAYGVSMLQQIPNANPSIYKLDIDGEKIEIQGVSIVIANTGNVGISGMSFIPKMKIDDGLLDVFVIRRTDFTYLASLASQALLHNRDSEELHHWQGKNIKIVIEPTQSVVCDDICLEYQDISFKVLPKAIKILAPKTV